MAVSEAVLSFFEATKLEENSYTEYEFPTRKQADSFRVALYNEKRNLRDNTVMISINENTVRLTKKSSVFTKKTFSPDGTEIKQEQISSEMTNYEKRVQEVLEAAEDFEDESKKAMFIADAMRQLHGNSFHRKRSKK